jgi:hypothetical protein
MRKAEQSPGSLATTRSSPPRDRFGALPPDADRSSRYWLEERPALALSFWVGRLWRRISARRRQRAKNRTAGPLGYRWCDATERHMINELIGLHRRPFRHQPRVAADHSPSAAREPAPEKPKDRFVV